MVFRTSSTCIILTRRKCNINKCVCSQLESLKRLLLLSLYLVLLHLKQSRYLPTLQKSLYVRELSLIKFSPRSREPFKEERVKLAAGVRATGKWAGLQVPPSHLCPSLWPAPYLSRRRPPRPPHHFSGPHSTASAASEVWRASEPELGGWFVEHHRGAPLPPAAPPPPAAEAKGVEPEPGEGKIYTHPPSSSPVRLQIQSHLLLF